MSRRHAAPLMLVVALALVGLPSPAKAAPAFFAAEPIDGPSADIVRLEDVDVTRDGTAVAVYVRRDGGVDHLFASRLINGAWQPGARVDGATSAPVQNASVAIAPGGRIAIAYTAANQLFTIVRAANAPSWPAAVPGPAPAATPSVEMSINGAAYVAWAGGGDVRAARLERTGAGFVALPAPLDIDPAAVAGEGAGRPKVAVAADGITTVVWGESGHVVARRLFELRPSTAPQQLDVTSLGGFAGGAADLPEISTEDDSSYAWVVFRQAFSDGRLHTLARRLRGSKFDAPVDLGPTAESAAAARIEINGRGQGLVGLQGADTRAPFGASLQLDVFAPVVTLGDVSGVDAQPQPAVTETGNAVLAWMEGGSAADAIVRARAFEAGKLAPDTAVISNPAFGPVDPVGGFGAGADRTDDVTVLFVQGVGDQRRLVAAARDRAPGMFGGTTTTKWRNVALPKLSWGAAVELWGPVTYTVTLDGQPAGQSNTNSLTLGAPVAEGVHTWQVVATDRRGQKTTAKPRELRVDVTAPTVQLRIRGTRQAGQEISFSTRSSDPQGSGVAEVSYRFGGAGKRIRERAVSRTFSAGRHTVEVSVTDGAGNVTRVTRRLNIGG